MAVFAACAAVFGVGAAPAVATNIDVTTTADVSADDEVCSRRDAIVAAPTNAVVGPMNANDCPAGDTMGADDVVQLAAATYSMTGSGDDTNVAGDFDITSGTPVDTANYMTIQGPIGPGEVPLATIDAANADRIFDIREGGTTELKIQQVILRNGNAAGASGDGGAIRIDDDDSQFDLADVRVLDSDAGRNGGAISVDDAADGIDVNIQQTEFSGNTAGDDGGALYVDVPQSYQLDVARSSLISNHATGMGGGAYIESSGSTGTEPVLTFTNSTLGLNSADAGGGAVGFDYGLAGTAFFKFSTIVDNSSPAPGTGGGIYTDNNAQFVLFQGGNLLTGNTAAGVTANCGGPGGAYDSLGYNIENGNGCDLTETTDLRNTPGLLAPLAFNGGGDLTTRTYGLYDESPALNRVPPANCGLSVDQRGVSRPAGTNCDVGAFEGSVGPMPVSPPASSAATAAPATAATPAKKCKKKKKKRAAGAKKKCKKKRKK